MKLLEPKCRQPSQSLSSRARAIPSLHNSIMPVCSTESRLSDAEEATFQRLRTRVAHHFKAFEELEGFAVLGGNLQRLLSQVALEFRAVFVQFCDAERRADSLSADLQRCRRARTRQREICDQVLIAAQQVASNAQQALAKRTQELQAFYAAQEKLQLKQWAFKSDQRLQRRVRELTEQHTRQLALCELEAAQQLAVAKEELESKKKAEVELMRVQLRLQLSRQTDRDTRDLLDTDAHHRRRRPCSNDWSYR